MRGRRRRLQRATFLLGIVALLVGVGVLIDPVSLGGRNCGSAFLPKRIRLAAEARPCQVTLHDRRMIGAPILAVGTVAVVTTRFRCLITPE